MFVRFCLGLIAFCALTSASELTCEEIAGPQDNLNLVGGRWILYAGLSDNVDFMNELKGISSSWMDVSSVPDTNNLVLRWHDKIGGTCNHEEAISSYSLNSGHMAFEFRTSDSLHQGKHLKTCPDCLLWIDHTTAYLPTGESVHGRIAFLFTRSGSLDSSNLEFFKKQLACENLTQDLHFFDNTNLCPDNH